MDNLVRRGAGWRLSRLEHHAQAGRGQRLQALRLQAALPDAGEIDMPVARSAGVGLPAQPVEQRGHGHGRAGGVRGHFCQAT